MKGGETRPTIGAEIAELEQRAFAIGRSIAVMDTERLSLLVQAALLRAKVNRRSDDKD